MGDIKEESGDPTESEKEEEGGASTPEFEKEEQGGESFLEKKEEIGDKSKDWSYKEWGEEFPACKGESMAPQFEHNEWQSPINIQLIHVKPSSAQRQATFSTDEAQCDVGEWVRNKFTFKLEFKGQGGGNCEGMFVDYEGTKYFLKEFELHSLSETTHELRHFDGEMHMRHEAADGKQLIIGVWLKKAKAGDDTDSSQYLDKVFAKVPSSWWTKEAPIAEEKEVTEMGLNPYVGMHLQDREFFSYMGSLTAPPCTSDVQWLMAAQADIISKVDLQKFRQFLAEPGAASDGFHHNYRPVQPLNGRSIQTGFFKSEGEPKAEFQAAVSEKITKINLRVNKASAVKLGSSNTNEKQVATTAGMTTSMMAGIVAAIAGLLLIVGALVGFRHKKKATSNRDLEAMGLTPDEYGRPDLVTTAHL